MSAQWQNHNYLILEGDWNDSFLEELDGFPDALHDDQVDSAGDSFKEVAKGLPHKPPPITASMMHQSYWTGR